MALDQCDWPYSAIGPFVSQETWRAVGDILLAYSRMLVKQRSDDRIFHHWSLAHTGTLKAHGLKKKKMNWAQVEETHLILMHNMEMRVQKIN